VQESLLTTAEPLTATEQSGGEPEATSPALGTVAPTATEEVPTVESAPGPRATARKRAAAGTRTVTRAKKAAAPVGVAKKKPSRPRAKKA
jgi:hypothetical protein